VGADEDDKLMAAHNQSFITRVLIYSSTFALLLGAGAIAVTLFWLAMYYFEVKESWLHWTAFVGLLCVGAMVLTRRQSLK